MLKNLLGLVFLIGIGFMAYMGIMQHIDSNLEPDEEELQVEISLDSIKVEVEPSTVLYGIVVDSLEVIEDVIRPRQNLSSILSPYNVPFETIHSLSLQSKKVFDVNKIMANKKYTLLCLPDSSRTAKCLIYEPNPKEYVIFNLLDSISVVKVEKETQIEEKSISGVINSSLWQAMVSSGASPQLAGMLSEVYAWQVDFFRVQPGDKFKVIYEEETIDGKPFGVGKILSACFEHYGKEYYAFPFDQGNGLEYFDEEGRSLRKAFLKAPLNYTRISSRYSPKRFHPVQRRYKAHLGTDYAAPTGTPIMAVGDGTIVEAKYGKFNGNYVKIKHNSTYTTQYLHMSRIAKGIKRGTRVTQGQIIGFVGKTGLASGPHLCYRFWKNGVQVDALRVEAPKSEPVKKELLGEFNSLKDQMFARLNEVNYLQNEEVLAINDEE